MDSKRLDKEYFLDLANEMSHNTIVPYDELPKYDLFLSQVIDYLNDAFSGDNYTNNIVQNYIKSDIISKPVDGKKRGYTKDHLAQLVLLSYMRPVLTTEEIKNVFSLAFNDINNREDDIISWREAYKIFSEIQQESFSDFSSGPVYNDEKLSEKMKELQLEPKDEERIRVFILVMSLVAQASAIKNMVQNIVSDYSEKI
ncbi:DUF1836 domain-containing protein [uncultured Clostridium sp.]|jgi:uncharacterized protein YeeX (DUF496 family)|uniref:DUF1836 domain-containing protein n=1 Tax=uncultured Clostridium sp. TaxID=59620 RepID=UPI00260A637C|nr:DUF1836 domain-containing protein [uncultured Clostridium sp.]